jgi:hypothetical protein
MDIVHSVSEIVAYVNNIPGGAPAELKLKPRFSGGEHSSRVTGRRSSYGR